MFTDENKLVNHYHPVQIKTNAEANWLMNKNPFTYTQAEIPNSVMCNLFTSRNKLVDG